MGVLNDKEKENALNEVRILGFFSKNLKFFVLAIIKYI